MLGRLVRFPIGFSPTAFQRLIFASMADTRPTSRSPLTICMVNIRPLVSFAQMGSWSLT
jgi:hypothetical protein